MPPHQLGWSCHLSLSDVACPCDRIVVSDSSFDLYHSYWLFAYLLQFNDILEKHCKPDCWKFIYFKVIRQNP